MWFQQDGAACHTAPVIMDLLRGDFGEHLISCSAPVNRSPRSYNLTPLDYCLWGFVNAHDFTCNSASIDAFEVNIEAFIFEIPA